MLSPASQHWMRHQQAKPEPVTGAAVTRRVTDPTRHISRQQLARLEADKLALESIRSLKQRNAKKHALLSEYQDYLQWALSVASGEPDRVVVLCCVWALDAGRYDLCLTLAAYAIPHHFPAPNGFQRSLPELLAEELALQTLHAEQREAFQVWLLRLQPYLVFEEINDAISAKFFKALALSTPAGEPAAALAYAQQASGYGASVKVLIKRLQKEIIQQENHP